MAAAQRDAREVGVPKPRSRFGIVDTGLVEEFLPRREACLSNLVGCQDSQRFVSLYHAAPYSALGSSVRRRLDRIGCADGNSREDTVRDDVGRPRDALNLGTGSTAP